MGTVKKILMPAEHRHIAHAFVPEELVNFIILFEEELSNLSTKNTQILVVADTREELGNLNKLANQHSLPCQALLSNETGHSLEEWTESTEAVQEFIEKLLKMFKRPSQKNKMLQLVEALNLFLFHDQHRVPYVQFAVKDHREHWPIFSSTFKYWLQDKYFKAFKEPISRDALRAVLEAIAGSALYEGPQIHLEVRSTWYEGALWIDLCDEHWRAIKVTPEGWEIVEDPPALFKRFPHQASLPKPKEGEELREFLDFLNVEDGYGDLILVWLVCSVLPDIPRPIITVHGPQGTGKSTLGRLVKSLIDPSCIELHRLPKNEDELVQALSHHSLMVFDNLDGLGSWASDCLCRAISGGGHQKRKLYTDDEDVVYNFKRAIILNSINLPSARPDLLDRSILIRLERIPWEAKRTEKELWSQFNIVKPKLFGAILDTLSKVMAIKPQIELRALPRMADWAMWGYAVAEALGIGGPAFMEVYTRSIKAQNEEVLAGHPVAQALLAFMEGKKEWQGSFPDLYDKLFKEAEKLNMARSKAWPATPQSLSRKLNTLRANLEDTGFALEPFRNEKVRGIRITTHPRSRGNCVSPVSCVRDKESQALSHDGTHDAIASVLSVASWLRQPQVTEKQGDDANDANDAIFHTLWGVNVEDDEPAIPAPPPDIETRLDEETALTQLAKEVEEEERAEAIIEEGKIVTEEVGLDNDNFPF
jgi:hypothetical protein